jgi:hypothetical protein
MGATILPDRPIPLAAAREWTHYGKNLGSTPLVAEHLARTLRSWVESDKIPNPLAIPWVRTLFDGDLASLERHLELVRGEMGDENMALLLGDLLRPRDSMSQILRSISSLFGEITAFRELTRRGITDLRKITVQGDWHGSNTVYSVKTLLDIDHNHHQIETALEGQALLAECPTIRAMRSLRIAKGVGLDYQFMNKLLRFVDRSLERTLRALYRDFARPDWAFARMEIDALQVPEMASLDEAGRLRFRGARYDSRRALLQFEDVRPDEGNASGTRSVELHTELRTDETLMFSTTSDLNAWWGLPELDRQRLGAKIQAKLEEVASRAHSDMPHGYVAWLNIEVHPSLQTGVAHSPDRVRAFLGELAAGMEFPVVFLLYGGFELSKPLLLEFPPHGAKPIFGAPA